MKKRNKKYNPNKLVNLCRNELAKSYELWSSFDDVELTEASNKLKAAGASKKQAIEGMYEYFDGDLVVSDVDKLHFFRHSFHQSGITPYVGVIQWCIHFVEHTERRWIELEDGEN
mgnify:CR=1 FL=1